ncbi:MAG: hypothetical protein MUP68_17600 [Deltaproteobacteria bacterium]|nr:hypothetical protein [Deltaproteobacteria bacterium]
MKKSILFYLLLVPLVCIPWSATAGNPVKIEVLYMNHGPLQDSLEGIKKVFSLYKGKVTVSWYDYDTKVRAPGRAPPAPSVEFPPLWGASDRPPTPARPKPTPP